MTIADLDAERVMEGLSEFLSRPRDDRASQAEISRFRELVAELARVGFAPEQDGHAPVAVDVHDARRERVLTLRVPHAHRVRDPHGPDGVSLADTMESIELVALTASEAIRSISGEVAHQETARERAARHIALCDPVRRWGEAIAGEAPRAGRLLVDYAMTGTMPSIIDAADARRMGLREDDLAWLLAPEGQEDLRARLVAAARVQLGEDDANIET